MLHSQGPAEDLGTEGRRRSSPPPRQTSTWGAAWLSDIRTELVPFPPGQMDWLLPHQGQLSVLALRPPPRPTPEGPDAAPPPRKWGRTGMVLAPRTEVYTSRLLAVSVVLTCLGVPDSGLTQGSSWQCPGAQCSLASPLGAKRTLERRVAGLGPSWPCSQAPPLSRTQSPAAHAFVTEYFSRAPVERTAPLRARLPSPSTVLVVTSFHEWSIMSL